MTTTTRTSNGNLTVDLQDRISTLPAGEIGETQLFLMAMAESLVQTARLKTIVKGMHERGMLDDICVDVTQGEPQFFHCSALPAMSMLSTPAAEPPGRFLNSDQAAKYLGLDVKNPSCTMSRLVKRRVFARRVKLNKLVFLREELDDYMAKGSWTGRGRPKGSPNKRKDVLLISGK